MSREKIKNFYNHLRPRRQGKYNAIFTLRLAGGSDGIVRGSEKQKTPRVSRGLWVTCLWLNVSTVTRATSGVTPFYSLHGGDCFAVSIKILNSYRSRNNSCGEIANERNLPKEKRLDFRAIVWSIVVNAKSVIGTTVGGLANANASVMDVWVSLDELSAFVELWIDV